MVKKGMTLHKTAELYTACFDRVCHNITSKFCTVAIFGSFVKENNDSNETSRYVHVLLLFQASVV
jgi:hypothetical protein